MEVNGHAAHSRIPEIAQLCAEHTACAPEGRKHVASELGTAVALMHTHALVLSEAAASSQDEPDALLAHLGIHLDMESGLINRLQDCFSGHAKFGAR